MSNKITYLLGVVISVVIISSLVACSREEISDPELSVLLETEPISSETDYSSFNTESSYTSINEYEVNALLDSFDFDAFLDWYCTNMEIVDLSSDNTIIYYSNYSDFLNNAVLEEDSGGDLIYTPEEYEYHISRSFVIDSIACITYEFDSYQWCEEAFSSDLNSSTLEGDDVIVDNRASEGYFFVYNDDLNFCKLEYLVGNCIVCFRFYLNNTTTYDEVLLYEGICSDFGLPICDRITEFELG